jgi:hypothetical protein
VSIVVVEDAVDSSCCLFDTCLDRVVMKLLRCRAVMLPRFEKHGIRKRLDDGLALRIEETYAGGLPLTVGFGHKFSEEIYIRFVYNIAYYFLEGVWRQNFFPSNINTTYSISFQVFSISSQTTKEKKALDRHW